VTSSSWDSTLLRKPSRDKEVVESHRDDRGRRKGQDPQRAQPVRKQTRPGSPGSAEVLTKLSPTVL
jgi:hypothetical protein